MVTRRMVGNEVDYDADAAAMRRSDQLAKILVGAVTRIYMVVVRHVVAMIAHRFGDRHQPHAVHAKVGRALWISVVDVVEMRDQTAQIPNAIPVGIGKRADKDLVADASMRRVLCGFRQTGDARPLRARKRSEARCADGPAELSKHYDRSERKGRDICGDLFRCWPLNLVVGDTVG